MTDATTEFFNQLARRGHEPLLEQVNGILRFDLVQGEQTGHFTVAVKHGDIALADENVEADCVVRADRALFDDIASGQANAMAAALRGALTIQGDAQMLASFQRLFPGPPRSRDQGGSARNDRRRS